MSFILYKISAAPKPVEHCTHTHRVKLKAIWSFGNKKIQMTKSAEKYRV